MKTFSNPKGNGLVQAVVWTTMMLVCWRVDAAQMLFDFGDAGSPTQEGGGGSTLHWNNITPDITQDDLGYLYNLVDTDGATTEAFLEMWSRFNAVNENGTLDSTLYPTSATRDSCYGNTESEQFYLFGCDGDWNVVTDTWHQSLDEAREQAEFEYEGVSKTWSYVG